MKTRNGFISNSSSCSFMVPYTEFMSTYELADYMILNRCMDIKEACEEDIEFIKSHPDVRNDKIEDKEKRLKENEKRYKALTKNLDSITFTHKPLNPNLAFSSCNFDTFIKEVEVEGTKYFFVSTCNNVDWDVKKVIPEGRSEKTPDPFSEGDLYDGLWDEEYLQGETFIVIDTKKQIVIKDRFKGLEQEEK